MSRETWIEVTARITPAASARVDALLERLRAKPGAIRPPMAELTREDLLQVLLLRGLDDLEAADRKPWPP